MLQNFNTSDGFMKNSDDIDNVVELRWNRIAARLVSIIVPGSGQLYAGKTVAAAIWFPAVVLAYLASPALGMAAHGICILEAPERDSEYVFCEEPKACVSRRGVYVFGVIVFVVLSLVFLVTLQAFFGRTFA